MNAFAAGLHLLVLGLQAEVGAVRSQENIAGQALQDGESLHVIVRDAG